MKRRIKRAFTLVELLVVIAILAVLASVAVVGYNSFTAKAEISVDEQAVTQMNKVLQADEVIEGRPESPMEVASILFDNGYKGDFTAYYDEYEIVWLKDVNVVALMKDKVVVYPEAYKGRAFDSNTYYFKADLPNADTKVYSGEGSESLHRDEIGYIFDGSFSSNNSNVVLDLDAAMNFTTKDTAETIQDKVYKDYYVDFVIRSNKDIDFTGYLWGYYSSFGAEVAIPLNNFAIEKEVSYNIMKDFLPLQYSFIVDSVKSFDCGIMVSEATKLANPGLEITLELWMYERMDGNLYAGESFLIGVPYTFKIC